MSMGVTATASLRDLSVAEILREADMSLYAAKRNGRNRVEIFTPAANSTGAGHS